MSVQTYSHEDITLCSSVMCTGCAACHDVCAKDAILMIPDSEGFAHPQIDGKKCVKCGMCKQACPVLHPSVSREPLAIYAAKADDDMLRLESSSGGIFSLLAHRIVNRGGIVFGAGWETDNWRIIHMSAETDSSLDKICGSKYVQSDTRGIYRQVKSQLDTGRQVVFSGTPCQIAALRVFLGKEYENLVLVDVICHAVPSPLVWQKYLETRLSSLDDTCGVGAKSIRRVSFRHKKCGWQRYSLFLDFSNDNAYCQTLDVDPFLLGFLNELFNRPSCSSCAFKAGRSGADLTLGDYWGVDKPHCNFADDKGVSVVLVNSQRGMEMFGEISGDMSFVPSKLKYLQFLNPALMTPIVLSERQKKQRSEFFTCFVKDDFDSLVMRLTHRHWWRRVLFFLKRCFLFIPNRIIGVVVYR